MPMEVYVCISEHILKIPLSFVLEKTTSGLAHTKILVQ